jgi:ATP-dependent Clp protease ATP-binding subunit ClpA
MGLHDPRRPLTLLVTGKTGVGKTQLTRALSQVLFHGENPLKFNMSEFKDKHSVSRLFGAPPGRTGFDQGGELTNKVRVKPYTVIFFDEFEKAHPDVYDVLLQVLDEGELTDGQGRKVIFRNCILIFASNCGVDTSKWCRFLVWRTKIKTIWNALFGTSARTKANRIPAEVMRTIRKVFRPEFLNRLDEMIWFGELSREDMFEILEIPLNRLNKELLARRNIRLQFTAEAKALLVNAGFDPKYGARPLERAIQRLVGDALAMKLLKKEIVSGSLVEVTADDNGLKFSAVPAE